METLRLNQALSRLGVASRRKADELIRAGRVAINGKVTTDFSTRVNIERDRISIDGRLILAPNLFGLSVKFTDAQVDIPRPHPELVAGAHIYLAFYKPKGVISTWSDERGRKCLADFFETRSSLIAVGRLDRHSEGLIIITTDGELANRLMHPRFEIARTYQVLVTPPITQEKWKEIAKGILLPQFGKHKSALFLPSSGQILERREDATLFELSLKTGRYREIRRAMNSLGLKVLRLKRVAYANINLRNLKPGKSRKITKSEISTLKKLVGL